MSEIRFVSLLSEELEQTLAPRTSAKRIRARRLIHVGGVALPWGAALIAVATATAAAITLSATTLFHSNPHGLNFNRLVKPAVPTNVLELAAVEIPDYGRVEAWGGMTKPGGFCFVLKLPDGIWGGLDHAHPGPHGWRGGWAGGTVPGCFGTQQQTVLADRPLKPGQQPSADGQAGGGPLPVEAWGSTVKNTAGQLYDVYIGYVEVQGTAATVRDSKTGATAPVKRNGYFLLAEPSPWMTLPHKMPGLPRRTHCAACDAHYLQVQDAAGQTLKPDYIYGAMDHGYTPGPTPGAG